MQYDNYKMWLQDKLSPRPISDSLSRCRRIEQCLKLDLDVEYNTDHGISLLNLLTYSTEDDENNIPTPQGICFAPGSNIKNGMSSLRSAAKKYFDFCESLSDSGQMKKDQLR